MAANKLLPLAFIAWNNDAGRGGVAGMKAMLPAGASIAYIGYFNVGEVDFSAHVTNIRRSDAKAVMLLMDEEPGALAIKQIRDAGLGIDLIGTLAMGSNRFLDRLDAQYLTGMVQYNAFPPNAADAAHPEIQPSLSGALQGGSAWLRCAILRRRVRGASRRWPRPAPSPMASAIRDALAGRITRASSAAIQFDEQKPGAIRRST